MHDAVKIKFTINGLDNKITLTRKPNGFYWNYEQLDCYFSSYEVRMFCENAISNLYDRGSCGWDIDVEMSEDWLRDMLNAEGHNGVKVALDQYKTTVYGEGLEGEELVDCFCDNMPYWFKEYAKDMFELCWRYDSVRRFDTFEYTETLENMVHNGWRLFELVDKAQRDWEKAEARLGESIS